MTPRAARRQTGSRRSPLRPRDTAALARRRARMDRVNLALRDLLQRRARLAADIAAWKHARGIRVPDPGRERQMLERMLHAPGDGFDRRTLARLLRAILRASRTHAERRARRR